MIQKLKKRYLIANMTLLSCTLLIALTVLFLILYHSEVQSSYDVMNDLLSQSELADVPQNTAAPMSYTPANTQQTEDTSVSTTYTTVSTSDTTFPFAPDAEYFFCYRREYYYDFPPYWDFEDIYNNSNEAERSDQTDSDDDSDDNWWEHQPPPPPPGESGIVTTITIQSIETTTTSTTDFPQHSYFTSSDISAPLHTDGIGSLTSTSSATSTKQSTSTSALTSTKSQVLIGNEGQYIPDAIIAQITPSGQVSSYAGSNDATPQDQDLHTVNQAIAEIREKGNQSGTVKVNDTSYRYIYQPHISGAYQMVLLNRTVELSVLSRMLLLFVLLAAFGLICMFGISVMLSNWTVRPIALAWEKQKQFVADASHELKTPLAVISANTEVILSNPQDSVVAQSKWLNYIKAETMRMSKLVTNLLTVARMDHTQESNHVGTFNFYELVSNACLVFEPIIYENGKTLNTVLQRNVMMRGDEDNLKQLLSILLDNAVLHSTPAAEITVTLSRDAQGKVRLAVANTAKDIPQDQLQHLFDRFYRLDTKGSPNGSGLGLSIAKSIVQEMGGVLNAHSENHLVTFVATFSA